MTSPDDRRRLLRIARDAIVAQVTGTAPPAVELSDDLARLAGAFVTVLRRGELRGCIGHIESDEPLGRVVARCARGACSADPRFPPVAVTELPDLDVELSVLGAFDQVASPDDVEPGRHGLLVELGRRRGLLLPQVASARHWNSTTFLAQTCVKAGLPPDAWRAGATVWRFEAEVFSDGASGSDEAGSPQ